MWDLLNIKNRNRKTLVASLGAFAINFGQIICISQLISRFMKFLF